ncbi:MAG: hypothetical protein OEU91_09405 [Gammaproteobacteria bacterium]|nr:hypothetical protein [Gammaproteobacteria bacterium]
MRYRIGASPEQMTTPPDQGVLSGIAGLSFLIGLGFVVAGLKSRHYWLTIWGTGLSLSSIGYLCFVYL